MGMYKEIKTNISETILNAREILLIGFIVIFASLSIYLVNDNQKLFEQRIFQDKVIDELLNKLNQDINYFSDEENSEFIKIYENIKDKTELKGRELRKYCIEQYFIKKVEEQE